MERLVTGMAQVLIGLNARRRKSGRRRGLDKKGARREMSRAMPRKR